MVATSSAGLRQAWIVLTVVVAGCGGGAQVEKAGEAGSAESTESGTTYCTIDDDCAGGTSCRGGVCAAGECNTRTDCATGQVCNAGNCVAPNVTNGCRSTEECPSPYLCDGFSHRCFDAATGQFFGGATNGGGSSSGAVSTPATTSSSATPPSTSAASSSGAQPSSSSTSPPAATSTTPPATTSSSTTAPTLVDLGGWTLANDQQDGTSVQAGVFPDGTLVPRGGLVIVGRGATQAEFEAFWGMPLPAHALYLQSGDINTGVPVVNGGEKWSLTDTSQRTKDGASIAGLTGKSYQRTSATAASRASSWTTYPDTQASPGETALTAANHGVFISEWSDASGTGNFIYEFVEIYVNP